MTYPGYISSEFIKIVRISKSPCYVPECSHKVNINLCLSIHSMFQQTINTLYREMNLV